MNRRLRKNSVVDSQINLRIHAATFERLKEIAEKKGYVKRGNKTGHCRLAREILEDFCGVGGDLDVGV